MRVAFIGKMGSGKTEATKLLNEHGFATYSFAAIVKALAARVMDDISSLDTTFSSSPRVYFDVDFINDVKGDPRIRQLLQLIGTDLGRDFMSNPDIWVNYLQAQLRNNAQSDILVDDCRFPNEAEMLKNEGFVVCRIDRPEWLRLDYLSQKAKSQVYGITNQKVWDAVDAMMNHPSETALDGWAVDYVIDNNGSLEEFQRNLRETLDIS